jgi:hypothetical protein
VSSDTRILFVHVPKTAGMSLYFALARAVGEDSALRFPEGTKALREQYLAMSDAQVRSHRLISGHFPLNVFLQKPLDDYRLITVVRDPVDRELSAYFYIKGWDKHPRHEAMKDMDLYQYLEERERKGARNPQCRMIGGAPSFEAARRAIDERYTLATPVEYLDEFCAELERRLGIGPLELERSNVTRLRLTAAEIHPEIIQRLERLTQGDRKLYRYVKEKFEREVLAEREDNLAEGGPG